MITADLLAKAQTVAVIFENCWLQNRAPTVHEWQMASDVKFDLACALQKITVQVKEAA